MIRSRFLIAIAVLVGLFVITGDGSIFLADDHEIPQVNVTNGESRNQENQPYPSTRSNNWYIKVVEDLRNVGQDTSIALDSNERPHISYYDDTGRNLKYAHYDGNQWQTHTIDITGDVGSDTSLALDSNDRPHISYHDITNDDLKYAHHNGVGWIVTTVDSQGDVGLRTSIVLDSNDRPHISYGDSTNRAVKYAYDNGTAWQTETVDSDGNLDWGTSIVLDSNEQPHICCHKCSGWDFKYIYYDGNNWHNETVQVPDHVGTSLSMVLDSNDRPHITYSVSNNLGYSYYDGNQWNIQVLDSQGDVGWYPSIELDSNERPHISYADGTNRDLKYIYYDGNQWITEIVDHQGNVGLYSSLAMDSSDNAHISYYNDAMGDLKYATIDKTPPTLDSDYSPSTGTTADEYVFNVSASDNFELKDIHINWQHGGLSGNDSLRKTGNYSTKTIMLDNSTDDLSYTIYVKDVAGNYNISAPRNVTVRDDDNPVLISDNSIDTGYTGDEFSFIVAASDNIEVDAVFVNWRHGMDGDNVSLTKSGGSWTGTAILDHSLDPLTYTIYVNDTSNNFDRSLLKTTPVYDNDKPLIINDSTMNTGTTGDEFQFNVTVCDNIDVDRVFVLWWHGGTSGNLTLYYRGSNWNNSVILDHDLRDLMYQIYVNDTSDNYNFSSIETVKVLDNDLPVFIEDKTVPQVFTGETINITVSVSDNIAIKSVNLIYGFHVRNESSEPMENQSGGYWNRVVHVPVDVMYIHYSFDVVDSSDNHISTAVFSYPIGDKYPPLVVVGDNVTIDQHDNVLLDGRKSWDNIGIVNYTWSFTYNGTQMNLYEPVSNFTFNFAGHYTVILNVTDIMGNWAVDEFTVIVRDTTPPSANAGPDLSIAQNEYGTFNAVLSSDNVGITNYTWTFTYDGKKWALYGMEPYLFFEKVGIINVTLVVVDEAGNSDSDNLTLTVRDDNDPEVIVSLNGISVSKGGKYEYEVNTVVRFDSSESTDNVGISNYTWTITGNGAEVVLTGAIVDYTFTKLGKYSVTHTIADTEMNEGKAVFEITITEDDNGKPPDPDDDDTSNESDKEKGGGLPVWSIILICIAGILLVCLLFALLFRRKKTQTNAGPSAPEDVNPQYESPPDNIATAPETPSYPEDEYDPHSLHSQYDHLTEPPGENLASEYYEENVSFFSEEFSQSSQTEVGSQEPPPPLN